MGPADEEFEGCLNIFMADFSRQAQEEEKEILPILEEKLGAGDLEEMANVMIRVKKIAPTRPHPLATKAAPKLSIPVLAFMDRIKDVVKSLRKT